MRSDPARADAVMRVVDAARRIHAERAKWLDPIAKSTGLSTEGVALAFEHHLEVNPREEDIQRLVSVTPTASKVHVILSANVFVGALRAIAVAVAASEHVTVKPSRRDPVFANALAEILGIALGEIPHEGEVHVYGRQETIDAVRASASATVIVRGHGPGFGVAIVRDDADAALIARDVVPFDQRGCLSPRLVMVEGGIAAAERFAEALAGELALWAGRVPRGLCDPDELAEAQRWRSTVMFGGRMFDDVGVHSEILIPPAGRHVHVVPYENDADLERKLAPIALHVAAVGGHSKILPRARHSALGEMQRPPLDGPVDLRALRLL